MAPAGTRHRAADGVRRRRRGHWSGGRGPGRAIGARSPLAAGANRARHRAGDPDLVASVRCPPRPAWARAREAERGTPAAPVRLSGIVVQPAAIRPLDRWLTPSAAREAG